jgi:hypothetical protein
MQSEDSVESPTPPKPFLCPLPRLRIGSQFSTRRGITFVVREAIVMVADSGGESPSLLLERVQGGQRTEMFLTVGMLANMTRGALHKPGAGPRIHWPQVPRQRGTGRLGTLQPPRLLQRSPRL